ncbi:hypothetical protein [Streptomyces sp. NPDC007063]|uniref:hypothetical protein n=2 Tax=unclassified Streptomyces TaxID=2593676 RepID=UPI003675A647
MLLHRKLPEELGELIEVHRPHHPVGWILPLGVSVPIAVLFAVGPPGPLVGLTVFATTFVPLLYMFAEWFLLEHRVHENALVLRTVLPGTYTYVVPLPGVDPARIGVAPRARMPKDATAAPRVDRRFRHNPLLKEVVGFTGLDPEPARELAKGKISWDEACGSGYAQDWELSSRDPVRLARQIAARCHGTGGIVRRPAR